MGFLRDKKRRVFFLLLPGKNFPPIKTCVTKTFHLDIRAQTLLVYQRVMHIR
jgi:hypothetical protein